MVANIPTKQNVQHTKKICNNCGRENHFAAYCKSKPQYEKKHVKQIPDCDEDDGYVFSVRNNSTTKQLNLTLNGQRFYMCHMLIDSGSSVNILDEIPFSKLHPKPKLCRSSTRIFAYWL